MGEATQGGGAAGPPGLLLTKLQAPVEREQTVVRERLLERLRPEPGQRLTVVAAPAGYGKTTLLGTWSEAQAALSSVAWLTIDEGDNDAVVLWSHVLEALRGVCRDLDTLAKPEVVGAARIVDVVLPRLVNALTEQGDVTLILDDFHRLSSGVARDSISWLIDHAPSTFRLILLSRTDPAIPLGALRAHGELLELRADELAFTADEADALLNGHLGLGLAREDVDSLVARTEGWPAGLYLVALSLHGAEDPHAFVRRFGGENRLVVDFLVDEVLDAHEPAMQALMLRSSILERLCSPLCDALLEHGGTSEALASLSHTNLFLVPLDDRGEWYRFHHLFAQLLRVELEHREPGMAPTLHRRAYAWHRDHGSVDEAIQHAVEAGAFAEAGELIAIYWVYYTNVCRFATVLGWLERFPDEWLRESTSLKLVEAWVLSLSAQRDRASEAIAEVEKLGRLGDGPLPDGFSSLEASLATLRAAVPWGDVSLGLENARRAAELEGPDSPWRSVVSWAMGMGLYFRGHFDEAHGWFAEAAALAPPAEQWLVAASSLAYLSLLAGEQGRVEEQRLFAEQATKLGRERGVDEVDGEVHLAMGMSFAADGKLEDALQLVERGVAILRHWGQPLDLAKALIREATLLRAMGEQDRAAATIAEARATVDSCPDPGILRERLAALEHAHRSSAAHHRTELTDRERAVLRLLSGPLSEREIGRELYLSQNTIHTHTQ